MTEASSHSPVADTSSGPVRGRSVTTSTGSTVSAFLGIPYAAPPVGPLAFAAPHPPEPWTAVRDVTEYGPAAPQVGYPEPVASILENVVAPGDDYLNVNVWTPDPDGEDLPVLVWIHGGAFTRGANRIGIYSGDTFARDGLVFVGVNYRLGAPGFASLDGAPENRGLLDQIAALEWVRDNIAAFGGDPSHVTVMGESAGAMSVASLLSSPRAAGLFGRAIMASGNGVSVAAIDDARKVTTRTSEILGVEPTAQAWAEVSTDALLAAQTEVALAHSLKPDPAVWGESVVRAGLGVMSFLPVIDGDVLPAVPVDSIAEGAGAGVALLAGWNADEFHFFLAPTGVVAAVDAPTARSVLARSGASSERFDESLARGVKAGDALCAELTRNGFSAPTQAIADARADDQTFLYEFGRHSPVMGIRAGHAVEIPYVFDHLDDAHSLVGPTPDHDLATRMHAAWTSFAMAGDPGWDVYRVGEAPRLFA
ncbi:carboxylesterase family protein [Gordonia sp. HY002]|uniref:carboxylesterase/lipase family protein n=1 Tax=Gordonia zhenghanii TaxID=2911516 RepID=UPI001EEFA5BD|nr:carboxylesterase family protein [Gordonia zhenghanii]MCF8569593.1 carboxylesterase family protein [Gordonia zhenghanii]MCF8602886.1 carboxylesterase family protein [Gordonia zhenghanii]